MKDIRVTVTSADGNQLYDQFGTNNDQLADERIAWTLSFEPDAQVTRTETEARD